MEKLYEWIDELFDYCFEVIIIKKSIVNKRLVIYIILFYYVVFLYLWLKNGEKRYKVVKNYYIIIMFLILWIL